jgi:hypothetical protein
MTLHTDRSTALILSRECTSRRWTEGILSRACWPGKSAVRYGILESDKFALSRSTSSLFSMIHVYLYNPRHSMSDPCQREQFRCKSRYQRFRRQGVQHKAVSHASTFFNILIFIGTSVCSYKYICCVKFHITLLAMHAIAIRAARTVYLQPNIVRPTHFCAGSHSVRIMQGAPFM